MQYPSLIFQPNSVPTSVSLWDAANIFEYVTSWFTAIWLALDEIQHLVWEAKRFVFPYINICATSDTSPALLENLNEVVTMLTHWQVEIADDDDLFRLFHTHQFNMAGNLMVCYQIVSNYAYSWWNDQFNPVAYFLWPEMCRHDVSPDPLLTNLQVIKDNLGDLGAQLEQWLSRKMEDANVALEAMTALEGLVDNLHDAIAASQQLLDGTGLMPEPGEYQNGMNLMPVIPEDWALHATNSASEWVEQQFLAHIAGRSLVDPPPRMDIPTLLLCGQLAWLMAEVYRHPIKLDINVIRYNKALAKQESLLLGPEPSGTPTRTPKNPSQTTHSTARLTPNSTTPP
ncbi:uncharacterized protein EDB91DRAFT_1086802 [Suillus paluster]|uniref:uncharacterized protein n=1 Tax=Suillus paluster TaxID=48578 RepID=UPI001B87EFD6|nr:uncharacterized protein EDB91DRAFT_1086802 [Suillus paluster]KAG1726349.1 hypothetical protein EDB91DRAFT_1086802 [Suillus paluster]